MIRILITLPDLRAPVTLLRIPQASSGILRLSLSRYDPGAVPPWGSCLVSSVKRHINIH